MARQLPEVSAAHMWRIAEPRWLGAHAAAPSRNSADRIVPQEHNLAAAVDSSDRDWSCLGRRVLAEAWRRYTEEHATRPAQCATPAVPASCTPDGADALPAGAEGRA